MRNTFLTLGILVSSLATGLAVAVAAAPTPTSNTANTKESASLRFEPNTEVHLRGPDARHQLIVTAHSPSADPKDVTAAVSYHAEPRGIVTIDSTGQVAPLAEGTARIIAEGPAGKRATIAARVTDLTQPPSINFANQIVPIFTKFGCNGGGCHGKSTGQNGFKLSLLGFVPSEDYEYIVKEAGGRRVFPAAPDHSLLLQKAINKMAHGGGERLAIDSPEYRLLRRWIEQGMPLGSKDAPVVERIEVFPKERRLGKSGHQQLAIVAHYNDGGSDDVTREAQYDSNDTEMATVSETGLVETLGAAGDVAIMARYQGHVAVFRGSVPLGVPIASMPQPRNFIDEHVFAKLKDLGIPPSPRCDDATFLRRVCVDLAGRLPTVEEVEQFLADTNPSKRDLKIDELLASRDYAENFATKWSAVLRNKRGKDSHIRGTYAFYHWIRDSLDENKPFDRFVHEIITASGDAAYHPPVVWYRDVKTQEQQTEDVAQLFLGMRIQCARCHHHPFETWSQRDYYGFAAFFSRVGRKQGTNGLRTDDEPRIYHRRGKASARNPKSGKQLAPTGLGSEPIDLGADQDPRHALVDWMTAKENPYFAPALVNRYWKHFFGRGLVDPEDDMRVTNPSSNPALLRSMSQHFKESGFDLKDLARTICRSNAYQLSSTPNAHNAKDTRNFSRFYPRRLTAEILYDAVSHATGAVPRFDKVPPGTRAVELPDTGVNSYFLEVFGRPRSSSACECERSGDVTIAQSLHLLNSKEVQEKLHSSEGRAIRLAGAKEKQDDEKIRELYLTVFARPPSQEERTIAKQHLESHRDSQDQAFQDLLWALINSKEFLFNH
ncbi:Bacterial Ig-like domain (group 2) [Planctomycetes bacterium Pan216]|uniref:Bacterial Ig-like domain (Group 2) n=1 Tax=Kolteria novifilia TaxID=2527975 RepID=A0A518B020_9BACT|nr:Bacterial Ig-like domain (group 2) [Planctomycetes bacterium Pan216]